MGWCISIWHPSLGHYGSHRPSKCISLTNSSEIVNKIAVGCSYIFNSRNSQIWDSSQSLLALFDIYIMHWLHVFFSFHVYPIQLYSYSFIYIIHFLAYIFPSITGHLGGMNFCPRELCYMYVILCSILKVFSLPYIYMYIYSWTIQYYSNGIFKFT